MTAATADVGFDSRQEIRTLTIVSVVHLVSHFYWLALAPLLPALTNLLGVSYLELGVAITLMNAVSAATQAPTGFMVDRFGARLLLVLGVSLGAAGFLLLALIPTYPALIVAALLIGLGNAVYHPANYSILSAEMSPQRMGRAYSVHTFSGYLGFAVAPPVVLAFLWLGGPQFALAATGLAGVALALPLLPGLLHERRAARVPRAAASGAKTPSRALLTGAVLALTLMFTLVNLSTGMMQTYMVAAVADLLDVAQSVGAMALTLFFFALTLGVLAGGFVADRTASQSRVALVGFGLAAAFVTALPIIKPGPAGALALIAASAFFAGLIMPSRDLLVRKAAPADAVGRVFGIVTTGFNFGGMIGPLIGGALIDWRAPAWVFYGSAAFMVLTIVVAMAVEKSAARAGSKSC